MSSRQEEKEQRRREREEAEQAAARSQSRKARLQLGIGALVAIAAIVVAVLLFSKKDDSSSAKSATDAASVALPAPKETDLKTAAKTAGCTVKTYPAEGRDHTTGKVVYKTNPPTSGNHNPTAAQDGLYDPGNQPDIGMTVHSLEHGRIDIQYRKGTPAKTVSALESLGSEKLGFGTPGYHVLVFENQTNMKAAVAATAWTQSLTCPTMTPGVYDAVRDFRTAYTDKGPELIP
jgi:uncharacterized protein YpmB